MLNPMLNTIKVDTSSCVFQSEFTNIVSDLNRVVSKVEGSIDGWKLVKDIKHLGYYLQFRMFTDNGLYYVSMSINSDKTTSGNLTSKGTNFAFYGRGCLYQLPNIYGRKDQTLKQKSTSTPKPSEISTGGFY
jgi:hypothetical protein